MKLSIHRPNEGYWTRMGSAVGAATLVLAGVGWLWTEMGERLDADYALYVQGGVSALIILGLGALVFWLLNKPNIVDFMVATELEMQKVNWPSRRELIGSTIVVIAGTFMLVAMLLVTDVAFLELFQLLNVIPS